MEDFVHEIMYRACEFWHSEGFENEETSMDEIIPPGMSSDEIRIHFYPALVKLLNMRILHICRVYRSELEAWVKYESDDDEWKGCTVRYHDEFLLKYMQKYCHQSRRLRNLLIEFYNI